MLRYENECVGCDLPCISCGRRMVPHLYCDKCNDDCDELFDCSGYQLCEDCLLEAAKSDCVRVSLEDV